MTEYTPGAGDVAIDLPEGQVWLKPTLAACLRLSASGERGPRDLADKCGALNFEAICYVIAAGLDRPILEVQAAVYEAGTINLFGACILFVHIVSNGGRRKEAAKGTEGEGDDQDPPKGG